MIVNWPSLNSLEEQRNLVYKFAKRIAAQYELWENEIELFFKGNQYHGLIFGENLYKFLDESNSNRFIQKGIEFIKNNKIYNIKCIIFCAFLKWYNQNFPLKVEKILDNIFKDENL